MELRSCQRRHHKMRSIRNICGMLAVSVTGENKIKKSHIWSVERGSWVSGKSSEKSLLSEDLKEARKWAAWVFGERAFQSGGQQVQRRCRSMGHTFKEGEGPRCCSKMEKGKGEGCSQRSQSPVRVWQVSPQGLWTNPQTCAWWVPTGLVPSGLMPTFLLGVARYSQKLTIYSHALPLGTFSSLLD